MCNVGQHGAKHCHLTAKKVVGLISGAGALLCEVRMFSQHLCGFSTGSPVPPQSSNPKTNKRGLKLSMGEYDSAPQEYLRNVKLFVGIL